MAMQTTLDTFTTVKQYYNSNGNTITILAQIPALEAPVTPSIEPIAVKMVEKLAPAVYTLSDISCYEYYSRLQSPRIYSAEQSGRFGNTLIKIKKLPQDLLPSKYYIPVWIWE